MKAETWTCNSCGVEGDPSREHLIHVAIGRVILANRQLSADDVRNRLQSDRFAEFGLYPDVLVSGEPEGRGWINSAIFGLLCRDCNGGWARELEEAAGEALYDFTLLRGPANDRLLRRWACFFTLKLRFSHAKTDVLSWGDLRPVLGRLRDPGVTVALPVLLARMPGSPRTWNFAAIARGWAGTDSPFIYWVIRGVLWITAIPRDGKLVLPVPTVPLTDGLRLHHLPLLTKSQRARLVSAPPANVATDARSTDS